MNDGHQYFPKDDAERIWRERHFNFNESVMGQAANITREELEGKDALDQMKYIFEHGYNDFSHVTLIKAVCTLAQEVDNLNLEIKKLKQQLLKKDYGEEKND